MRSLSRAAGYWQDPAKTETDFGGVLKDTEKVCIHMFALLRFASLT